MQVCSSAVRPARAASLKAAKVWPPDLKGEDGHAMWPSSTRPKAARHEPRPVPPIVPLEAERTARGPFGALSPWVARPIHWPGHLAAGEARRLSRPHCYIMGCRAPATPVQPWKGLDSC